MSWGDKAERKICNVSTGLRGNQVKQGQREAGSIPRWDYCLPATGDRKVDVVFLRIWKCIVCFKNGPNVNNELQQTRLF